jgi:hypothetical protein
MHVDVRIFRHIVRKFHPFIYSMEARYIAPLRRGIRVALPENIDRRYYLDSWPWYIDTMAE